MLNIIASRMCSSYNSPMQGRVFRINSDFYYVDTPSGIVECKLREILKKMRSFVITGDIVELDSVSSDGTQAFISKVLPRKNFISRPKVANITQAVIVSSLKEPDLSFEQLNRCIVLCEYHNIKPVLCLNKNDLSDDECLKDRIVNIYRPLGYSLIFTSALSGMNIDTLKDVLKGNVSILCGTSGVGKSSIINLLFNELKSAVNPVSDKSKKGTHTTRHCEIFSLDEDSFVVDTPGFSNVRFNFLMPKLIEKFFPEIMNFSSSCKYNNCLHIDEDGCSVLENINDFDASRYESYTAFVSEAKEYKTKITFEGKKSESGIKFNKGKQFAKISDKKRKISRKKMNQSLTNTEE